MLPIRLNIWLKLGVDGFMACLIGTIVCVFLLAVGYKVRPRWFVAIGVVFGLSCLSCMAGQFAANETSYESTES